MKRIWLCIACVVLSLLRAAPVAKTATRVIGPCESSASSAGGVLLVCPAGDGPTLSSIGATVSVTVRNCNSQNPRPIPGIQAEYLWIMQPDRPYQPLCGLNRSSDADSATDSNGQTTISGSIAAGGYSDDALVVVMGVLIGLNCGPGFELSLILVSPDINADLLVDIVDLVLFGSTFPADGPGVDPRMDLNGDDQIDLIDFSLFGQHFGHVCGAL